VSPNDSIQLEIRKHSMNAKGLAWVPLNQTKPFSCSLPSTARQWGGTGSVCYTDRRRQVDALPWVHGVVYYDSGLMHEKNGVVEQQLIRTVGVVLDGQGEVEVVQLTEDVGVNANIADMCTAPSVSVDGMGTCGEYTTEEQHQNDASSVESTTRDSLTRESQDRTREFVDSMWQSLE
jgi:hypothetical protein